MAPPDPTPAQIHLAALREASNGLVESMTELRGMIERGERQDHCLLVWTTAAQHARTINNMVRLAIPGDDEDALVRAMFHVSAARNQNAYEDFE